MTRARTLLLVLSCALVASCATTHAASCARAGGTRMHAHNDYNHARPLLDALAAGASSIEADVFVQDGVLLVGHDRSQLTAARSLEAMYLRPLFALWQAQGRLLPPACGSSLLLLIDFKADPEASYRALAPLLSRYRAMLSHARGAAIEEGAVRVVISGERPLQLMARESEWLAGYDGRVLQPDATAPAALVPLVSESWDRLFSWTGHGDMPAAERARLQSIVTEMHSQARMVRFWATPDRREVWRELVGAGVDYINTDSLHALQVFFREQHDVSLP